jgi:hypothetical protein
MAARSAGVASVTRRPRKWRLRLDSAAELSPSFVDALESWAGAQVSPSGEITLPMSSDDDFIVQLLEFLQALKSSNPQAQGIDVS